MMSGAKSVISDGDFSPRVCELRKKIHDKAYIDYAVQRIAQVLSRTLVENREDACTRSRYGSN